MTTTINIPAIEVGGVVVQEAATYTVADAADIASLQAQITSLAAVLDALRPSITITANNQTKIYGQAFNWVGTEFVITSGVLEPGDSISGVSFSSPGAPATAQASAVPYQITPAAAQGIGLAKYNITYLPGNLTVDKASLTIAANNETFTLGSTAAVTLNAGYRVAGLLNTDVITSVTLASIGTAPGISAGNYPITITGVNGTGLANYTMTLVPGTLTLVEPTPKVSPDGSSITAPSTSTLITLAGAWSFGAGGQPGGYAILLNGASASGGSANELLVFNSGQMYALNKEGQWYIWKNNAWVVTSNPQAAPTPTPTPTPTPVPPVASAPMPSSTGVINTAVTSLIASMKPNSFAELPGTVIGASGQNVLQSTWVTINNPNKYSFYGPAGDNNYPWGPWCGGALDTARNRLFGGPGGGHLDSWNNSVYGFSFEDLKWRRLRDASSVTMTGSSSFTTDDGAPIANHNYNGLTVHPDTGNLWLFSGFGSPEGNGAGQVWEFDPVAQTWTHRSPPGSFPSYMVEVVPEFDYVPALKKFVGINYAGVGTFDPVTNTWTAGGEGPIGGLNEGTVGVDFAGGFLYYLSNPDLVKVPLTDPPKTMTDLSESALALTTIGYVGYEVSDLAPNLPLLGGTWDSKRNVLTAVSWDAHGQPHATTIDPSTLKTAEYILDPSSFLPVNTSAGPISKKWLYWPQLDVFVLYGCDVNHGIIFFKPGTATPIVPVLGSVSVANPGAAVPIICNTPPYAANHKLVEGGTITIKAGTFGGGLYLPHGCTVMGAQATADGKTPMATQLTGFGSDVGNCVPTGVTTVLNNLELFGASDGEDASGVRGQGQNITVNNCWVHNCSMCYLGAPVSAAMANGALAFNNSWFTDSVNGQEVQHNIYVSGKAGAGDYKSFIMTGGGSLRANGQGHLVKSRAISTTLIGCTLLMEGANSSRCVDICDAGAGVINGCLLEQGPNSDNSDIIGYGREYLNNAIRFDYAMASSILVLTSTATIDPATPNTLDITSGSDLPTGYQVYVTAPTGSTLPLAISAYYNNNPSLPFLKWNSIGPMQGTLGNAAAPISLAGGVGPLIISVYAPNPNRTHSLLIENCTFVFDLTNNVHSDPKVVICTNSLVAPTTLNGVTVPAVSVTVKNCTIINRSVVPLQWAAGVGDPINNVIDGGGNTIIDEHAKPGSLAIAGMQPYPWMPPLPVAV